MIDIKKKKSGNLLIAFGIILLVAALVIVVANIIMDKNAKAVSDSIIEGLPETTQGNPSATPDYILNPDMPMPTCEVNGLECVGTIEIPSIGVKLPVIAQYTQPNLHYAPCLYYGSAYTDNMVIAGHNYASHFRNLPNVKEGDKVIFTDLDGNVFTYTVAAVEALSPDDVDGMISGEWSLTLFTCNTSRSKRITVRCDLDK